MKNILIIVILILGARLSFSQAPYPPSSVISDVKWEDSSKVQFGLGSDQWPMTWSGDDALYTSWGDGWGWTKEKEDKKRSIGVSKIEGTPPQLTGKDLWGDGPGQSFGKPEALIALGDILYMFWTNGDSKYDDDSYAAISIDGGLSWDLRRERLFTYVPAGFRVRGICQYGTGYEGATDDYLYIYFGMNRHPDIYLARVLRTEIFNAFAYEWFTYIKTDGDAAWTRNFNRKAVVFHDNNAYLWHLSVCFNPGLKRYLLAKPHFKEGDNREVVFAPKSKISSFGIFDAPTPWGPWTTVFYKEDFIDDYVKFNYVIPTKFLSEDGRVFWLAWSGWPEYDNVNFMKGTFVFDRN